MFGNLSHLETVTHKVWVLKGQLGDRVCFQNTFQLCVFVKNQIFNCTFGFCFEKILMTNNSYMNSIKLILAEKVKS